MIHQPSGGAQGQQSDIEITYHEITKLKKELYQIIADHSGAPFEKVWDASDRDYWMIAEEAKEFGMVDEILRGNKGKISFFSPESLISLESPDFEKENLEVRKELLLLRT
jgi:ATP-dependent protease ClpP protease subunit